MSVWVAAPLAIGARIAIRPVIFLLAVPLLQVEAGFREFVIVTLLQGWPGIVLQILLAPTLVALIEGQRTAHVASSTGEVDPP